MLAVPTQLFRGSCGEGTPAAVADTDVGVKYAIKVANNRCYVDPSDTDSDAAVIHKFLFEAVDSGDINPEAIISILPAAFQGGATAT
jgi:hypothetical protein